MTILNIIKEICELQDAIFLNITLESVDVYLFLKDEYKKGNVKNNIVFQFVFRSYYRLDNAGLSDKLKERYFDLLAGKQTDLEYILSELYKLETLKGKNSIQFSFATKLLHTLDNNKPIFDAEVARVIHRSVTGIGKEEKIDSCRSIYNDLIGIYYNLINDEGIKKIIFKFRKKFSVSAERMTDIKVLDFIVWSLGKLKKKKPVKRSKKQKWKEFGMAKKESKIKEMLK